MPGALVRSPPPHSTPPPRALAPRSPWWWARRGPPGPAPSPARGPRVAAPRLGRTRRRTWRRPCGATWSAAIPHTPAPPLPAARASGPRRRRGGWRGAPARAPALRPPTWSTSPPPPPRCRWRSPSGRCSWPRTPCSTCRAPLGPPPAAWAPGGSSPPWAGRRACRGRSCARPWRCRWTVAAAGSPRRGWPGRPAAGRRPRAGWRPPPRACSAPSCPSSPCQEGLGTLGRPRRSRARRPRRRSRNRPRRWTRTPGRPPPPRPRCRGLGPRATARSRRPWTPRRAPRRHATPSPPAGRAGRPAAAARPTRRLRTARVRSPASRRLAPEHGPVAERGRGGQQGGSARPMNPPSHPHAASRMHMEQPIRCMGLLRPATSPFPHPLTDYLCVMRSMLHLEPPSHFVERRYALSLHPAG
uniref:Uncharacterized protein n=1 Tax=Auxenochlorella protothecoides TaxID=3075 RepID=A0A1D2ADL9_AUXPR